MPKIIIKNLDDKTINTNEKTENVLAVIQGNFLDWMHACGGKGRCTTCKMRVLAGMNNLSPVNNHESRYRNLGALAENERLTCQSILQNGEIEIEVPDTSKLPHIDYSY